jgi:glucokinase
MKGNGVSDSKRLYVGVDVGGTKVLAALVEETGAVLARERVPTPRDGGPEPVVAAIEKAVADVLAKGGVKAERLTAMGVAIPGVVDPKTARVVVTPNMSLTGVAIGPHLEKRFGVPVAIGNDCNFGALGEKWLGSARRFRSVLAMLVGTGIGGGIVQKGKLWRGAREAAAEVGHIVMQIDGPLCGCGNRGCLEALASRTAIERDLRAGIAAGRQSILPSFCNGDLSVIRSGAIRRALEADDPLVVEVVRRAAEILAYACLTIRHLLDPEVIVLGGGVIEACSEFIVPIVEGIVAADRLPGARDGGHVLLSALGDDAVVLGAVAQARKLIGRSPFKKRFHVMPKYPQLSKASFGQITAGEKTYKRDIFISVFGQIKKRDKNLAKETCGDSHVVGPKELEKVCRGGPEVLFIGAGNEGRLTLSDDGRRFLRQRSIQCEILPTPKLVEAYNKSPQRKASLIHVTC